LKERVSKLEEILDQLLAEKINVNSSCGEKN
jgi:hypothetical protein